jgi:putative tryptophan/tyrosine transport system substrate-binding protein
MAGRGAGAAANQIKRIAYIACGGAEILLTPIKRELAKLGWVEGHNMHIEAPLLTVDGRVLRAAAPFVVSSNPDLIVVISTEAAQIFKEATDTIPILFAFVADPIASDLVKSFARPSGVTGFTNLPQSSLTGRWLSLLEGLVPGIDRVMVLHDPVNAFLLSGLQDAASALHVTIHSAPATAIADAEREIETFARDPSGGMIVVPYPAADRELTAVEQSTITALAAHHRLPAIYGSDIFVGGLMTYAPVADDITGVLRNTPTVSSKARNPPIFRFRRRPGSGWSSTPRLPGRSA